MYLPNVEEYGMIYTIVSIVWYVLLAAGLWKTFEKAHESGWKAIIPIYNFYLLFKIAWQSRMFWLWLAFSVGSVLLSVYSTSMLMYYIAIALSIVASVMLAVLWYNVSLAYGHGFGYFLGLYLLNPIFIMILGFGNSRFIGNRYEGSGI
ncbi:DUF5684 domain-containing protein [Ileibacterium valens]|uniref:DUF5684 domain-containing protein n=1 Tax=Ileibacterium valens TaxID=1862668 RepID=UPI0025733950|nr:DUF5684 domain-containing protein [Ileibacterium valens]